MSNEGEIPARVRALIQTSVRSIEEVEILLRLRAAPSRTWSAEELAADVRVSEAVAGAALQRLVVGKLVTQMGISPPPGYRYHPYDATSVETVNDLADAYEHHRATVLMLISSEAIARARKHVLMAFDAPDKRRKNDEDG